MKLRQLFETKQAESIASAVIGRTLGKDIAKVASKETNIANKTMSKAKAIAQTDTADKKKDSSTIGVCFGRWNPPHKGHRAAWEIAAENDTFYVGTNQNTEGPNDPLPYDIKLKCMETIWPGVKGHVIPEQSLFTLVSKVFAKHGESAHLKVATDEEWLASSLIKYNGVEGPHGFYKFASIQQVPTPRLSSATALRAAVRAGNREAFSEAAGVDANTPIRIGMKAVPFFDLVASYLEKHPEKPKRAIKAKEEAAGVGTITKQNSTADVNAGTPRKNLKAFHLVKEGINMQAITEKAKQLLAQGMTEQQTINQLVKQGIPIRLAQQAVQAAQINETFLQELENAMLSEAGMKPIEKSYKASMKNASTLPALNMSTGSGGAYMNYRMSIALAGAPNYPTKMEADNWIGGDPLLSTYTEEEFDMIKQAAKQVGAGTIQNWSGKRSQEVADVNKTSTVAKIKKNKYGV
jgi:hypothetical protein